jgi:hypothetical protein
MTPPPVVPTIYMIVVCTLALVLLAVILVMLAGLFDPIVDNEAIFKILAPAFQTVVGVFCGVLGSRVMNEK